MLINNDSFLTHQTNYADRLWKVSHIVLSIMFPRPPNFILRLLDMPKLSLNLIIPLTSVFQPQFLLGRVFFGTMESTAKEHRRLNVLPSSAQMRQLILPCPHQNKKELLCSLAHRSELESFLSPRQMNKPD